MLSRKLKASSLDLIIVSLHEKIIENTLLSQHTDMLPNHYFFLFFKRCILNVEK